MSEQRLIDANTVVTIQVFDEMTEEYSMETITVAKAIDRWSDEGCPPTIDAVPVVHARLKETGWDEAWCPWGDCTNCGHSNIIGSKYCNKCGAKLYEDKTEE